MAVIPNTVLRERLSAAGLTAESLAARLDVDAKTVRRWLADRGRVPRPQVRVQAAEILECEQAELWPAGSHTAAPAGVVAVYPSRTHVPVEVYRGMLARARDRVDLVAYAALHLVDGMADFVPLLGRAAERGTQVRIALGDPGSPAVALRGQEEGIGEGMAARVALQTRYLDPLRNQPGVDIATHGTTLYASILRADDDLLVNHHLYGSPASRNPVLHLRADLQGSPMFDAVTASVERVWATINSISTEIGHGAD